MGWPSLTAQTAPAAIVQAVLTPICVKLDQPEPLQLNPAAIAAERRCSAACGLSLNLSRLK